MFLKTCKKFGKPGKKIQKRVATLIVKAQYFVLVSFIKKLTVLGKYLAIQYIFSESVFNFYIFS